MKPFRFVFAFSVLTATIAFSACTEDELPEPSESDCPGPVPTYDQEIRPIIEATCAYSGCHLGGAPGLYNNYAGMLPNLESGIFEERTIDLRADPSVGMPPDYAPADRPRDLTPEELQLIECWLAAGYPEN